MDANFGLPYNVGDVNEKENALLLARGAGPLSVPFLRTVALAELTFTQSLN